MRVDETSAVPYRGLRRLAAASVAATVVLIAMGGAVRATNSGLACSDWPACYAQWIPPADGHMWLGHSHRLVASWLWAALVLTALLALLPLGQAPPRRPATDASERREVPV